MVAYCFVITCFLTIIKLYLWLTGRPCVIEGFVQQNPLKCVFGPGDITMKKTTLLPFLVFVTFLFSASQVFAHCEIPCGIYDDGLRLNLIQEHITTIEKSMNEIKKLEGADSSNQLVRWIMNKEEHANQLQHIITQYFMTQRIKPDAANYEKKLTALHQMLVYAMKCKQTVDLANVGALRTAAKEFHDLYQHN